jgi:AAA domain/DnaB-like helicase N terminal domain
MAEDAFLGALLCDNAIGACGLVPGHFAEPANRSIFAAAVALMTRGGSADCLTVAEELGRAGLMDAQDAMRYANQLAAGAPPISGAQRWAPRVAEQGRRRQVADEARMIDVRARSGADADEIEEAVKRLAESANGLRGNQDAHRYELLKPSDLRDLPPPSWWIHGFLPAAGTGAIYGPSGTAKSAFAINMAAANAEGAEWFGHRSQPGRWVYLALEGQNGIANRVAAWERWHDRPFPEQVSFVLGTFRLTERVDVLAIASAVDKAGGADVIVIDTLNRAAPGADENSSGGSVTAVFVDHTRWSGRKASMHGVSESESGCSTRLYELIAAVDGKRKDPAQADPLIGSSTPSASFSFVTHQMDDLPGRDDEVVNGRHALDREEPDAMGIPGCKVLIEKGELPQKLAVILLRAAVFHLDHRGVGPHHEVIDCKPDGTLLLRRSKSLQPNGDANGGDRAPRLDPRSTFGPGKARHEHAGLPQRVPHPAFLLRDEYPMFAASGCPSFKLRECVRPAMAIVRASAIGSVDSASKAIQ